MNSGRIEENRQTSMATKLLLAVAFAVILIPLNAVAQETDSERWEQVRDCEDLISVEMFLVEYPDSPHVDDARNCLAGVQTDDTMEEEPEDEALGENFSSDTLTGTEKRFLQTGLALTGYYNGMLDGEWGNRSQKAIEEFARVEYNDIPRRSHSAALANITSTLIQSGWQIRYVDEAGISILAPGEDFERAGESRFFQNWEDPASSLRYSFAWQPKAITLSFHRFAEEFSSGVYPSYEVRKPNLLVTHSVDAEGSVLYARSDLIVDTWATVMLSSNSEDANLLSTIASSIAVGTQPPLELPETGDLAGSLHMLLAQDKIPIVEDQAQAEDCQEWYWFGKWHWISARAVDVEQCIAAGSDPNNSDDHGWRPVHQASMAGNAPALGVLLDAGADPDARNVWGLTPLHIAAETGNLDVLRTLVEADANLDAPNENCQSPLHIASEAGNADVQIALIVAGADPDLIEHDATTLHPAIIEGNVGMVRRLVESGMDLEARNSACRTPLQVAAAADSAVMVNMLIESGADIFSRDNGGRKSLHIAAEAGNADVVALLIEAGIDPDASDDGGHTPLFGATNSGNADVVRVLLDAGADPNALNLVPAMAAAQALLTNAAYSGSIEIVRILIEAGADPNRWHWGQGSPLSAAIRVGDSDMARLLIEAGADPNSSEKHGYTILQSMIGDGNLDMVRLLLFEAGADPNELGGSGILPLAHAIEYAHSEIVQLLLDAGADPNLREFDGQTPLHIAQDSGQTDIVQALLEAGADPNASSNR